MKRVILAMTCAAALAACGGGGGGNQAAQLTKLCMAEDGATAADCECMSKAAVDKLDGPMIDMLIKAGQKGADTDKAMADMMGKLTPEQMGQFMTFAMEAGTTCGLQ